MELSHKVKMSMPAKCTGPLEGTVDFFQGVVTRRSTHAALSLTHFSPIHSLGT